MVERFGKMLERLVYAASLLFSGKADLICGLLSTLGMYMFALLISFALIGSFVDVPVSFILLISIWFFIALILQKIILTALGVKRQFDYSWEGSSINFRPKYALPVVGIFIISAPLTYRVFFEYFRQMMLAGKLSSFDQYSIQPFICIIACAIMAAVGILVPFYHYSSLMSLKRVLTCTAVGFLLLCLSGFPTRVGVCYGGYMLCAALILNQSCIMHSASASTVTKLNDRQRFYDMRMTLLWLFGGAVFGLFAFMFVGGVWYIIKFLIFMILWTIIHADAGEHEKINDRVDIDDSVFNSSYAVAMVLEAIIILIGVLLLVIFMRSGAVQAILSAIKSFFESFIALFMGREPYQSEREINYLDETETIASDYSITRARQTFVHNGRRRLTYREFCGELNSLKTDEERLTFSYVIMIGLLHDLNPSLSDTDTPRELAGMIKTSMTFDGIDGITETIELVSYADKFPSPEASRRALTAVCGVIEKRLTGK